jgi:hypothetical protein
MLRNLAKLGAFNDGFLCSRSFSVDNSKVPFQPEEDTFDRGLSGRLAPSVMTVFTGVHSKCFRSITRQRKMLGEDGDDQSTVTRYGRPINMNMVLMAL